MMRCYTPAEVLTMATATIGDPPAAIKLIADPAKNLVVITNDGRVFKNPLRP
jgi:hypothetical protein